MIDRLCFDVAVVGLDTAQRRLIEIVFRHIRHNRFGFRLDDTPDVARPDILIAGADSEAGSVALERARAACPPIPSIAVKGPGGPPAVGLALESGELVRRLLPILNRLVEIERIEPAARRVPLESGTASRLPAAGPAPAPAGAGAQAHSAGLLPLTPAGSAGPIAAPRPARPRVLVVDDSPSVRAELQAAFVRMGIVIDTAGSAGEALERMARQPVDLALLDIVLPDLDGFRLARRIRSQVRWRELPIVVLSGRTSVLDICRGAAAGCSAYLGKPVRFDDLRRTVAAQLGRVVAAESLPPQLRPAPA